MVKTTFVSGSVVTPEFLNAINNGPIFDGADLDGHRNPVSNADLDTSPGQILPEWQGFRDSLKVTAGTGLTANYQGGTVRLQSGVNATVAPGVIALQNNATNYIYVNELGVVANQTTYIPLKGLLMAQITTVGGVISGAIIDLRPRFQVQPLFSAVRIFGGSGDEGAYTLSGTATLSQGEYFFSSLTINASAVLTIDKAVYIRVSGDVIINGTVNVTTATAGGGSYATAIHGGFLGGFTGTGIGAGVGNVSGGVSYSYILAPHGSGGASGFINNVDAINNGALIAPGGRGGGGLIIDAGGTITVNGVINAIGGNGGVGATSSPNSQVSGGGAGSGGLILLRSLRSIVASATATLDVRGGKGGNPAANSDSGGFGGGGGIISLIAPSVNTTGATLLLAGGVNGATTANGTTPGGGGGGAGGGFGGIGGSLSVHPTTGAVTSVPASAGLFIVRQFLPIG